MISKLTVFHRGGAVLWSSNPEDSDTTPVNTLVQNVLLSDRAGTDSMVYDSFTLKWTFANNFNLVFVAAYFSLQKLLYIDDLLETVKNEFIRAFEDSLKNGIAHLTTQTYDFDKRYGKITKYFVERGNSHRGAPKTWGETSRGRDHQQFKYGDKSKPKKSSSQSQKDGNGNTDDDDNDADGRNDKNSSNYDASVPLDPYLSKLMRDKSGGPRVYNGSSRGGKSGAQPGKKNKKQSKKQKKQNGKKQNGKKEARDWMVWGKRKGVSQQQMDEFNIASDENDSSANGTSNKDDIDTDITYQRSDPNADVNLDESDSEEYSSSDEEEFIPSSVETSKDDSSGSGGIWSRFTKLIGNAELSTEDLKPALVELEKLLTSKNVTNVIARKLCDNVARNLVGKQIGTFNSIKSSVKNAMTESLESILTPERPVNILHGIANARQQNRPYSIVFIGVNGVGKSTSLSKVISYLKTRNLQVSVAACDTFRSGAVEQLRTHCKALEVRLFQQGYARDASAVANAAVKEATKRNDDVVLIDTAGRMQNNEPLMRALVSLISRNNPDLVLFVGEALVGNDGVDQLCEFNRALKNLSQTQTPRLIDGIVLTKFDTVDDKVGAAISMTYESKKPIVFVGVGQHYSDLKRMHVNTLISKLLQ